MNRGVLGLVLASAGLLATLQTWALQQIGPTLTRFGEDLGEVLAPTSGQPNPRQDVDWSVVERGLVLEATEQDGASAPTPSLPTKNKPKVETKTPASVFVSAERVLRLSREASVPASRYVPAIGRRPAGLQVAGVTGLGIGVRDGDVLTQVAGMDVRSSAAVVSTVLRLRAKKVEVISGELWRGQQRIRIMFEMPYLDGARSSRPGLSAKGTAEGAATKRVLPSTTAQASPSSRANAPQTSQPGSARSGS